MLLKNRLLVICFSCATILSCTISFAQELVKDINSNPHGQLDSFLDPRIDCYTCGNKIYFFAGDATTGKELWVTDGTEQGTQKVKEVVPGSQGVSQPRMKCNNGIFYFTYNGVWKSDGTPVGTDRATDRIAAGEVFGFYKGMIAYVFENKIYLVNLQTDTETVAMELTPPAGQSLQSLTFVISADYIYVETYLGTNNTDNASQLWRFDGTSKILLWTSTPGNSIGSVVPLGDNVLFHVYDEVGFPNLWVSDGTVAGTKVLSDESGIIAEPHAVDPNLTIDGVLIRKMKDTWITDGTIEGTKKILDNFIVTQTRKFGGKVYFYGHSSPDEINIDYSLIRTDLDYSNRVTVATPDDSNATLFGVLNNKLLLSIDVDDFGEELFAIDQAGELSILKDINPGQSASNPDAFASTNNVGTFLANDGVHGFEMWRTDGTAAGTSLLKDIATGTASADLERMYEYNGNVYFGANATGAGYRLMKSDGTPEGTVVVSNGNYSLYNFVAPVGKYVITDSFGFTKTDLETGEQTVILSPFDYNRYSISSGRLSVAIGDDLYFRAHMYPKSQSDIGIELWRANVATNEVKLVKDINPGKDDSGINEAALGCVLGNKMYFGAISPTGNELWVTDGTPDGTREVADIEKNGSSNPLAFTPVGNKVYFIATTTANGRELWVTDGTTAGTHIVKDMLVGAPNGVPSESLTSLGDKLIFPGTDGAGMDPWISDGTPEGTHKIKDLPAPSNMARFTTAGDKVYFIVDGGNLWVTDGTENGTYEVEYDESPVYIDRLKEHNGILYFQARKKLYRTFGTSGSTQMLGPANPTEDFYVLDNYVVFTQADLEYGTELFRVPIPDRAQQTITFSDFEDLYSDEEQNALIEISTGFPLTVTSSDPSIAEYLDGKLVIHKAGTVTFTASNVGDEYFFPVSASKEITIMITGLIKEEAVAIFPNPVDNTLFVKTNSSTSLRIVDMNGREKHHEVITGDTGIDVSLYAAGMYIVMLDNNHFKFIKR